MRANVWDFRCFLGRKILVCALQKSRWLRWHVSTGRHIASLHLLAKLPCPLRLCAARALLRGYVGGKGDSCSVAWPRATQEIVLSILPAHSALTAGYLRICTVIKAKPNPDTSFTGGVTAHGFSARLSSALWIAPMLVLSLSACGAAPKTKPETATACVAATKTKRKTPDPAPLVNVPSIAFQLPARAPIKLPAHKQRRKQRQERRQQQDLRSEPALASQNQTQLVIAATATPAAPVDTVYFGANEAAIVEPSPPLNALAAILRETPRSIVIIEGHADANESNASALSKRRAQGARDYLLRQGVPRDRVVLRAHGTRSPSRIHTEELGAQNRRVELLLQTLAL